MDEVVAGMSTLRLQPAAESASARIAGMEGVLDVLRELIGK